MYREGLLFLAIALIIIGAVLYYVPLPEPVSTIGWILLVIGIVLLVIWIVLYAVATIKSGA